MSTTDEDAEIVRYIPATVAPRTFKGYPLSSNSIPAVRIAKIDKSGVLRDDIVWNRKAGVGKSINFSTESSFDHTESNALYSSGLQLICNISLLVEAAELIGGSDQNQQVLLYLCKKDGSGRKIEIDPRKMQPCTALVELQSGRCLKSCHTGCCTKKEMVLDFYPGCFLTATNAATDKLELVDEKETVWYTMLDVDKLNPLSWAKDDACFTNLLAWEAMQGRRDTVQIKWIKEKTITAPQHFRFLKTLDQQLFTDFIIKCSDGIEVPCHRSALAMASDVLKQLLVYKKAGDSFDFGTLFEADSKTTLAFLRCIYTDLKDVETLKASFSVTVTLLKIAVEYKIPELVKTCIGLIMDAKDNNWLDQDLDGLYRLWGFVRLLKESMEGMVTLEKKIMMISAKLLAEQNRKRRRGEVEADDGFGDMLEFKEATDRKLFKDWIRGVIGQLVDGASGDGEDM